MPTGSTRSAPSASPGPSLTAAAKGERCTTPPYPRSGTIRSRSIRKGTGPTINHFYEKLLLLADRMNTPTGKRLAAGRHRYLEQFLEQFLAEWEGQR